MCFGHSQGEIVVGEAVVGRVMLCGGMVGGLRVSELREGRKSGIRMGECPGRRGGWRTRCLSSSG